MSEDDKPTIKSFGEAPLEPTKAVQNDDSQKDEPSEASPKGPNKSLLIAAGGVVVAAVVVLAVVLLGGSSKGNDQTQIKTTFEKAAHSLADGNGKEFCSTLTVTAQGAFTSQISSATGASSCADGVTNLLKSTKALAAGDWKTFCTAVGTRTATTIANAGPALRVAKSCEAAAAAVAQTATGKKAFGSLGQQLDASLGRLKNGKLATVVIKGDTATAALLNATATDRPIKFQKVNGDWKISE